MKKAKKVVCKHSWRIIPQHEHHWSSDSWEFYCIKCLKIISKDGYEENNR